VLLTISTLVFAVENKYVWGSDISIFPMHQQKFIEELVEACRKSDFELGKIR